LLARSATGQAITTYTSHFKKPRPGGEMHIVIVDNGRSQHLGMKKFVKSLSCIRCGACMNTCPIYRRSGGHSYNATVPGPIGSVLSPARNTFQHASLPFASTLCGSCTDVCPVKIDLHHQLLAWREEIVKQNLIDPQKRDSMKMMGIVLSRPWMYKLATWGLRIGLKFPKMFFPKEAKVWLEQRDLPKVPAKSFKDLIRERKK
jgi:L-lactate dehydrogenase complex protein LldF